MTKPTVTGWGYVTKMIDHYFVCRKCHIKFHYSGSVASLDYKIALKQRHEHEKTCDGTKPEVKEEMSKQKGINFNEGEKDAT